MTMMNEGMYSSKTPEWATPIDLFNKLNAEFKFQLDVCATPDNAKCHTFFSPEKDGLQQNWGGVGSKCFMNPPYGREIGKWIHKAYEESSKGALVVCLLPARTDTKWFHDYIYNVDNFKPREGVQVRFLKGRVKFGGSKNSAPFPSMVVIFDHAKQEERG